MKGYLRTLILWAVSASINAAPIALSDPFATVLGDAEDSVDVQIFDLESPPSPLPLAGNAMVTNATSSARVGTDSLGVDVAIFDLADASATADLVGTFFGPTPGTSKFRLDISFDIDNTGPIDDTIVTDFIFSVLADGITLLEESLSFGIGSDMQTFTRLFALPDNAEGTLGLTLSTAASGVGVGSSSADFNFQLAAVDAPAGVSEPTTLALLAAGGLLLAGTGRRARQSKWRRGIALRVGHSFQPR